MLRDRTSDELGTAAGVVVMACTEDISYETGEACQGEMVVWPYKQSAREGWRWLGQVADGLVVPLRPGNAGAGKERWSKRGTKW